MTATPEVFLRDKSRKDGLAYECRECHRERKKGRDSRTDRWSNMTPAQREKVRARQHRYNRSLKGRAAYLRAAYAKMDDCDLSHAEVLALISQPCVHCGTTTENRGLDRIDNSKPHIKGNVAPSCAPCNFARGDRFTFEEMQQIGAAIRRVIEARR